MKGGYESYESEWIPCPHCGGFGSVNCRCGGDQCYCENHGDAPCPLCFEDGQVSPDDYKKYMANLAEWREIMKEVL